MLMSLSCGYAETSNERSSAILSTIEDRTKDNSNTIFQALMNESRNFSINPLLLMAVIETESGFKTEKRGRHGEIGLMQIKPSTARWIAKKNGLPWNGAKTLKDPAINIKLGAAYLSFLREEFDSHKQHYLSAYNMGARNVRRALKKRIVPKEYASRVLRHYRSFYSKTATRET